MIALNSGHQLALPAQRRTVRSDRLIARLMAWRLRRLQLFHGCPNAGEGAPARNRWSRRCRFADRKIAGLLVELGRTNG